ncbi:DUF4292 domain-containing protein [Flavobacterium sp. AG291]|uniref:DUF4292 domain-containing protein n=1 Tax=Flavobacterium sp. AG291 TaxID=2184000 RepID=UPI000E0CAAAE|nr:DUF4292 domain-containing protein [Flavobacterium sp. AG291]RDI07932.1 uncharacterized protein DUF4292 [Flavobacterium sp. AG291]
MKKLLVITLAVLSLKSCKTAQKALISEDKAAEQKAVKEIVDGHYSNAKDFKTLLIKASGHYKKGNTSFNANAEIRVKKDEIILVSVRVLGITVAKAIITPTRVSYYAKTTGEYFDGNYAALSKWLGNDLDYTKVQNILLGNALYDLNKGKYIGSLEDGMHKLQSADRSAISKLFLFEGGKFLLKKETFKTSGNISQSLDIQYASYKEYPKAVLPAVINIEGEQQERINVDIEYNTVTFDENLTFPYEVPEGMEQIFID